MNQEIGSAIWAHLRGASALTNLLNGGTASGTASIYVDHAPDSAGFPYVLISQQSGQWAQTMGAAAADRARSQAALWQVRAVSGSAYPKEAEAIDSQIDARLHDASLTIGGYTLLRVGRESDVRFPETEGDQIIQNVGALYRVEVQKT